MLIIRPAEIKDIESITEIYNEAIATTTATFDTEPKSLDEQRKWLESHDAKHPVIVAELKGAVAGWASLSPWSDRPAYSGTAENSVYVKSEHRGKGIGKKLLQHLLKEAEHSGIHSIIARIAEGNERSIKLHKDQGFEHIGVMKEVGVKFGRLLDVYLMQKIISDKRTNLS
jgi:phosphinothricin acetyltransferase